VVGVLCYFAKLPAVQQQHHQPHNSTTIIMSAPDPNAVISEVAKGGHELKHAETVDKSVPLIPGE